MTDARILLLGGTGAMGRSLGDILVKQGNRVFVTTRSVRSSNSPSLSYIHGNAHDEAFLKEILQNQWDAIVDFMIYSTVEFAVRVPILLDATKQYVFLSSARVYADSVAPITEDSPRLLDVSSDEEYLECDEYALRAYLLIMEML